MKILIVAHYTAKVLQELDISEMSGFGYAVDYFAEALARENNVSVVTSKKSRGFLSEDISYVSKDYSLRVPVIKILKSLSLGILKSLLFAKPSDKLRVTHYCLFGIKDYSLFKNNDLIIFHGLNYYTIPRIDFCRKNGIPFYVHIHGLNYKYDYRQTLENKYVKTLTVEDRLIVVSSGVRDRIRNQFDVGGVGPHVILNASKTEAVQNTTPSKVRKDNILLVLGSITQDRNQLFLLNEELDIFLSDLGYEIFILGYLGRDGYSRKFRAEYNNKSLKNIKFLDFIPQSEVFEMYRRSRATLSVATNEGYGLPILEGFSFGLPAIVPECVNVYADICRDKLNSISYELGSVARLKDSIRALEGADFSEVEIKNWASQFSQDRVASAYNGLIK